ncbi:MAG: hypothetical protein AB1490_14215 [Pseudomonadota bacterium]
MKRIALAAVAALAPFAASAATPLDDLIAPVEGKEACFIRVYKPDHLKTHPKQKTKSINVWLKYEKFGGAVALGIALGITMRNDPATLFSQGGCDWSATANRDTSDRRLIKNYPKEEGAVCTQSAQPDVFEAVSAEEGGYFIIAPGKDRNTLMVYLDDQLTMVKRANRGKHLLTKFGPDDRVFMLQRVEPESCTDLEEAVTTPEPGVKRR